MNSDLRASSDPSRTRTESLSMGRVRGVLRRMMDNKSKLSDASDEIVWEMEAGAVELVESLTLATVRRALRKDEFTEFHEYMKALKDEADVRRARHDPDAFMEYCFEDDVSGEPVVQGDMHREWQALMGERKHLLLIGPREHGKSTQIIGRTIWELGKDPNKRIKIVSNNDEKAKDRVLAIQEHIENNAKIHRVFPHLRPGEKSRWTTTKLFVQRSRTMLDPSVEGCGVLGSGTGGRCDILILDDVVDRRNALTQPGLRAEVITAVKTDWLALLSKGGWAVSICTLWHKKDLNHELGGEALKLFLKEVNKVPDRRKVPDQSNIEEGQWYVSFHAVGPNFESVWPEGWTTERLKAKYRTVGKAAFNRGWRNIATDDGETVIEPGWIVYYVPRTMTPISELTLLQSYDLALSSLKSDKNSKFAAVTFALDFGGDVERIYTVDAWEAHLNFPQQFKAVQRGHSRFQPIVILMESVYYQAALAQFLQHTTLLPIVGVKPTVSKKLRLEGVSPVVEAGHVLFNPRMDPESGHAILERGDLVSDLVEFPFGDHDDLVDAFSQGVGYIQKHLEELSRLALQGYSGARGNVRTIEA